MNGTIKITVDTPDGEITRNYDVNTDTDYNDIIPDMIDSLQKSVQSEEERNKDHADQNYD